MILLFLVATVAFSRAETWTWVPGSEVKEFYGQTVKDRHEFVCTVDAAVGTQEFKETIAPGVEAIFTAGSDLIGNAGGPFYIFTPTKDGKFIVRGCVAAHPSALVVLPTSHNGLRDLKTYIRNGADGGTFETWEFNGKQYAKKSTRILSKKEAGKDFDNSFKSPNRTLSEAVICPD